MRRTDLSHERLQYLVPGDDYPHVYALVAPPTPRRLTVNAADTRLIDDAMQVLQRLAMAVSLLPNSDMVTRTLARREAVQSSQIEGTRTELHELLEYELTQTPDGLPSDASVTERYVEALDHGLQAIRGEGHQPLAVDTALIRQLHASLMRGTDLPPIVVPVIPDEVRD